jgi:hypothetical protein
MLRAGLGEEFSGRARASALYIRVSCTDSFDRLFKIQALPLPISGQNLIQRDGRIPDLADERIPRTVPCVLA